MGIPMNVLKCLVMGGLVAVLCMGCAEKYECHTESIGCGPIEVCCTSTDCYYKYNGKKYPCDGTDCTAAAEAVVDEMICPAKASAQQLADARAKVLRLAREQAGLRSGNNPLDCCSR